MRIRRKTAVRLMLVAALITISGLVSARWPIPGEEWAEITFYNSYGEKIGGMRVECDGTILTWGKDTGQRNFTLHPCDPW